MENGENETEQTVDKYLKKKQELELEKEQKIVNLVVEMVVLITINELYEKGNKIFKV